MRFQFDRFTGRPLQTMFTGCQNNLHRRMHWSEYRQAKCMLYRSLVSGLTIAATRRYLPRKRGQLKMSKRITSLVFLTVVFSVSSNVWADAIMWTDWTAFTAGNTTGTA